MDKLYSIKQTAEIAGTTTETLRHYDRIGLVKPCKTDEWTGYRYYSEQEIVRLHTIRALRLMDLTLTEIRDILSYTDFGKIVAALVRAEENADRKIAELIQARDKIRRARTFYQSKSDNTESGAAVRTLPQRVILVSDTLTEPSVYTLWDYLRHFYKQLPDDVKDSFTFEDTAGLYECGGRTRMFAVCRTYTDTDGLVVLPEGPYLTADCTEQTRAAVRKDLLDTAKTKYGRTPAFSLQMIVLSGILQWNYQAQVYIG